MYIPKTDRHPDYDLIVNPIKSGIVAAVQGKDKSHIAYVLLRAAVMAWKELGEGYNDGSDVRAILEDVCHEFGRRMDQEVKRIKERYGDLDDPIKLPERPKTSKIVDKDGKPLS